jgi:hypothetical protein
MTASGPIIIFCAPEHVFGGIEGVGSRFHVLSSHTSFWRNRASRVPFSCFTLPDSFSAVSRASGPSFIFFALRPVFSGTKGVGSRFHVLLPQTHFHRYLGRRVPISHFALPILFSLEPSALGPIFMFCTLCNPFSRAPPLVAMGCGRRTRRSLLSVYLFNAG